MGESYSNQMIKACATNNLSEVQDLINKGIDIKKDSHPLKVACAGGHTSIVECLLSNGADINQTNYLFYAIINGHIEVAKLLISYGADVNTGNGSCLFIILRNLEAIKKDCIIGKYLFSQEKTEEIIELLTSNGASIMAIPERDRKYLLDFGVPTYKYTHTPTYGRVLDTAFKI